MSERASGLAIVDRIVSGDPPASLSWCSPTEFSTNFLQKYILTTREERIKITEAMLPAIGFQTFVLQPELCC